MKIKVLQTGSTLVSSAVPDCRSHRWKYAYTDLFQRRSKRIGVPVKAFLVEMNGHRVLIDTGWSAECLIHPIRHLGFGLWFASAPVMKQGEDIPSQLKRIGLNAASLDAIVLTHLDCDHVSGLSALKDAKHIYCSEEEWHHAQSRHDVRYRSSFWRGVKMETLKMSYDDTAPYHQSCDLFGDGSIKVVLTPGHSEGSSAVIVNAHDDYVAFVGDDAYNRHSWEDLRLPGPMYDQEKMMRTLKWVQSLSRDPHCLGIYAAHDPQGPSDKEI